MTVPVISPLVGNIVIYTPGSTAVDKTPVPAILLEVVDSENATRDGMVHLQEFSPSGGGVHRNVKHANHTKPGHWTERQNILREGEETGEAESC